MKTICGVDVELDGEGFFRDPAQWTEEMVPELAAAEGITDLTEDHRRVVKFMRVAYETKGTGPPVRALSREAGICVKDLYRLFPGGPAKVAARIAGIPKPRGCI
jgi:tRNA 2-thiouridine synthesizing protein E